MANRKKMILLEKIFIEKSLIQIPLAVCAGLFVGFLLSLAFVARALFRMARKFENLTEKIDDRVQ
jgi:hypothetical protein